MALPGGPLEICFSFDTTVSMTRYIDEVKARLQSIVQRLQADIPGIRIALCAHGDYYYKDYDNKSPYEMIKLDFTDDLPSLCQFIQKAEPTNGGDWEEFYEYVIKEARENLSWSAHTNKVFVLIGDALPHSNADECNLKKIDWRQEVQHFVDAGVTLYGTYCKTPKSEPDDRKFFEEFSRKGGGSFLKIEDFEDIFDTLMAICYRESGETALNLYEQEVKSRKAGPSRDVNKIFTTLKKSVSNASSTSNSALKLTTSAITTSAKGKASKPTISKTTRIHKPTVKKSPTTKAKPTAKKLPTKNTKLRKTIKTAKPVTKAVKKNTTKVLTSKQKIHSPEQAKLRREKVPETNFILRELPWSSWKPVFCFKCLSKGWEKRQSGIGYKALNVFKKDRKGIALYEFSVRSKFRGRKVVVFTTLGSTQEFASKVEQHFKSNRAKSRLDIVLKARCVVYVRRLILSRGKIYQQAGEQLGIYSYLWDTDNDREYIKDDVSM